jgi:hypothetical protein
VKLNSDFSRQVRLPAAGDGISTAASSAVTITIVQDIQSWMNNIDLSGLFVMNNEIVTNV